VVDGGRRFRSRSGQRHSVAGRGGRHLHRDGGRGNGGTARKLIQQDRILPDETTVLCITGNGLKTTDVLADQYQAETPIAPKLAEFEAYLAAKAGRCRQRLRRLRRRRLLRNGRWSLVAGLGAQTLPDFDRGRVSNDSRPMTDDGFIVYFWAICQEVFMSITVQIPPLCGGLPLERRALLFASQPQRAVFGTRLAVSRPEAPSADEAGETRRFLNIYVNEEDIRFLAVRRMRSRTAMSAAGAFDRGGSQ